MQRLEGRGLQGPLQFGARCQIVETHRADRQA
ncbi:hypothetical protein M2345_002803 [Sphingobium sp. B8D3D]|nr:hypothetical protein [Sphingobium sp. B8D3D]